MQRGTTALVKLGLAWPDEVLVVLEVADSAARVRASAAVR